MIFETHAHYDDEAFDSDRDAILLTLREEGVTSVINVSADPKSLQATYDLMNQYSFIYGAFGLHPDEIGAFDATLEAKLLKLLRSEKAVAVGEIGLDYHWDVESHDKQKYYFTRQMEIAREENLPIIVHSRDAAADTLDTMKKANAGEIGGVIHSYSYSVEMAREFLNLGFYLGIGGVLTFKNARKIKEVVAYAPMERLLLETDSPYLAPVPFRGKRNSSLYLPYVVEAIADIKGTPKEEVMRLTYENARNLFLNRRTPNEKREIS